jgi:two-component system, OmpR family, sensor histidine kinase KdpD
MLIRRGRPVADFVHAECLALFVHRTPDFTDLTPKEREAVEKHFRFARNLRIETQILAGEDVPRTVVDFARRNQVTQIFVARLQGRRLVSRNYEEEIVRIANNLQVTVVADRSRRQASRWASSASGHRTARQSQQPGT